MFADKDSEKCVYVCTLDINDVVTTYREKYTVILQEGRKIANEARQFRTEENLAFIGGVHRS